MADPTPKYAQAGAFWGIVSRAAGEGVSATEVQKLVSAEAERLGVVTTFGVRQELSRLFSSAVQLRVGSERLTAAAPGEAITGSMLGQLPFGGSMGGAGGPRVFDVRVNYTAVRTGQEEADYVTLRYTGGLPPTVGELRAEAEAVTSSLVEGYGAALTSVGSIQIGEL